MTKVAVVGMGYWGPNLVRNLQRHERCEGLVLCDQSEERLAPLLRQYPAAKGTQSFDEALSSDTEAMVIATPVGTHFELAKRALEAGKHVFVEKPMAPSAREAEELVELAEAKGRVLMVGHTFEYSPPVKYVRNLMEQKALGQVFFVSSMRVNLGLFQKDVSVIWDLAPHDFSILFAWLGEEPVSISATGKAFVRDGIPDVAFVSMTFPSGAIAHVEVSWLAPSKLRRTTVVGDKKMLVYDDTLAAEKIKLFDRGVDFVYPQDFGEFQLAYRTGDILIPKLENTEPLAEEMGEFLSAIGGEGAPRSDGQSGLRVVRALEAAQRSLESGGGPVRLSAG